MSVGQMEWMDRIAASGMPSFFFEKQLKKAGEAIAKFVKKSAKEPQEWSPKMRWQKWLMLDAAGYNKWLEDYLLLDLETLPGSPVVRYNDMEPGACVDIPGTEIHYQNNTLPALQRLQCVSGNRRGWVAFDGDVIIPTLRENNSLSPWMSMTPFEIFSLRAGVRTATGHTVVAGLGLGYQLLQVARKRTVHTVTLVEQNQALLDWVLPKIEDKLNDVDLRVVCGDAYKEVPKLRADALLVDIARGYGSNEFDVVTPHIPKKWVWGSAIL